MSAELDYMNAALRLARRGEGMVSPNPLVGAVVVRDGEIVGKGYHAFDGGPHAEEAALVSAGSRAKGATLYCTLEPCAASWPGKRRPPCVELVIASGVSRVVVANRDPDPRVNGRGIERLHAAGIKTVVGIAGETALRLNEAYFANMTGNLPYIHLKIAQTLDGRIAAADGNSKWITDDRARRRVYDLRAASDAVLVGIGTVLADDPELTVRDPIRQRRAGMPFAVVLDRDVRLPLSSRLVRQAHERRVIVVSGADTAGADACLDREAALRATNVDVIRVPAGAGGVDTRSALVALRERGVASVLVEGGATVFSRFVEERLFHRLTAFIAPRIMGRGLPAVSIDTMGTMDAVIDFDAAEFRIHGSTAVCEARGPLMRDAEKEAACSPG
jgi:diaminohydroxyphosphoribosylaminopyrimidine deaminase/5-amino-6-(5-phosphoribosylamino)uracil reductase